jgi:hypothetical protein
MSPFLIGQAPPVPAPVQLPSRTTLDIVRQRTTAAAIGGALLTVGLGATLYGFRNDRCTVEIGGLAAILAGSALFAFARSAEA